MIDIYKDLDAKVEALVIHETYSSTNRVDSNVEEMELLAFSSEREAVDFIDKMWARLNEQERLVTTFELISNLEEVNAIVNYERERA